MGLLRAKKILASMAEVEKESQGVEDLIEKYNHKIRINFILNRFIMPIFITAYQSLNFRPTTSV